MSSTVLSGCPEAGIGSSGETAPSGSKVNEEEKLDSLELPRKLKRGMDFPAEYTLTEVTENREWVRVVYAVSPPKTNEIAQFHLSDLETRGYTSGDNPSRILEGVEYIGGKFARVWIQVTESYKDGTIVTIEVTY